MSPFRVSMLLCALLFGCAKAGKDVPNPATDAPVVIDDAPPVDIDAPEVVPVDAPNGCATQPCDILSQCGCAAGSACDLDSSDATGTTCRTVFQPVGEGAQCANATRCNPGFVCLFGSSGPSICKEYCDANADCGQPRGQCVLEITSGGQPIADVPLVCSSNCDPQNTAAGGCAAGMKCGIFTVTRNAVTHNITDCSLAGAGAQGAACLTNNAIDDTKCAADFLCTTAGTVTACRRICNRTANTGCTSPQTCIGFGTPLKIPAGTGIEYGVCN